MSPDDATCVDCDGRGWNLRDCRIEVCHCGTYDPPKWVTCGDTACLIPHHKDPARPRRASQGYVCAGHRAGLEKFLAELPALYEDLGLVLRRSGGTAHLGGAATETVVVNRKTGEEESPAWISAAAADAREEVHNECVRIAREVSEGSGDLLPTVDEVSVIARWLFARIDWLCNQLDVDETFGYLTALTWNCKRVAYPTGLRKAEVGPCGGECPGTLWLRGESDENRTMSCDDCKRIVEPRYWRRERKRIDGVDANPWLTLTEAAVQYGCTTRTVERWVAKGKLKARGTPMRVKASAVEALMGSLINRCA